MVAILNGFANDNGVNETLMITGLAKSFFLQMVAVVAYDSVKIFLFLLNNSCKFMLTSKF